MWKFKSCPRCGGDQFIEEDMILRKKYWNCLQCGFNIDLNPVPPLPLKSKEGKRERFIGVGNV